ncbi:hypothetical protein Dimus_026717, partial [Dionaea muscipula]
VHGGGNAANALVCAARLSLNPRLMSKVADDVQGRGILEELEPDGVDTSYIIVGAGDGISGWLLRVVCDRKLSLSTQITTVPKD